MVNLMNNKIAIVLKKLVDKGYDAYVVGGYVRDYLLGINSYDVDIATNADPNTIKEIYSITSSMDNYGRFSIKDSLYNYDIMPYREEYMFENRKPTDYKFINDIEKDKVRRDFTVNAMYMDINGEIYDPFNGKSDIENKIIRCIGDVSDKMIEDPLRILRAIRFATILDFKIEDSLLDFIKLNSSLISTISSDRRKIELDKIFKCSNKIKGLDLIKELSLDKVLSLKYDDVKYTISTEGIWAQIESTGYNFSNQEKTLIECIKKILEYGIIDNIVLYQYGLYPCIIAGEILGVSEAQISNVYKDMPIYTKNDINITGNDIMDLLHIKPGIKIKQILQDVELNILNGDIKNEEEEIKEYIIENWK